MKDFGNLKRRFRQFGGWRLVWQYYRMGVLWTGVRALVHCAWHGRSFKAAYPVITQKVEDMLVARYRPILDEYVGRFRKGAPSRGGTSGRNVPKIVWFSWLQGMDEAPEIVKVCLESQRRHLADYEFRILDLEHLTDWIELPEAVVVKFREGLVPPASFSGLVRLAVLQKYGGVWMDASVFCSGFGNDRLRERWDGIMRSELTLFRYFKRGVKNPVGLSTWFIAAVPNQVVISAVLDMLLSYWRDFDCLMDYYIIHLFFGLALQELPEVMASMPRANSYHSLLLGNALGRDYREEDWQELIEHVSIHKLNYRKAEEAMKNPNGYCAHLYVIAKTNRK